MRQVGSPTPSSLSLSHADRFLFFSSNGFSSFTGSVEVAKDIIRCVRAPLPNSPLKSKPRVLFSVRFFGYRISGVVRDTDARVFVFFCPSLISLPVSFSPSLAFSRRLCLFSLFLSLSFLRPCFLPPPKNENACCLRAMYLSPLLMLLAFWCCCGLICRIGEGGGEGRGGEVYFGFSAAVNMRGDREARRLMGETDVPPRLPAQPEIVGGNHACA